MHSNRTQANADRAALNILISKVFQKLQITSTGITHMENTPIDVRPDVQVNVLSTVPAQSTAQTARYTARELADRYPDLGKDGQPLQEGAIRTRWYGWIVQVAPEPLLKDGKGFTQLAADLLDDFAHHVKRNGVKAETWVQEAKSRYSQEWADAGVIDGELMPAEVGGTLALAQNKASNLAQQGTEHKAKLLRLIDQARSADASLTNTQKTIAEQRGINSALQEFEVELEAKLKTLSELRQMLDK